MKGKITYLDYGITQEYRIIPQEIYDRYRKATDPNRFNSVTAHTELVEPYSMITHCSLDKIMKMSFCTTNSPIGKAILTNASFMEIPGGRTTPVAVELEPQPEVYSVCGLMLNYKGEVLSVSRRNNHTDFGMPGGKCDPGETPIQSLVREIFEETNIVVDPANVILVYQRYEPADKICQCFLIVDFDDTTIIQNEGEGIIAYQPWKVIIDGSFGKYNENLKSQLGL